MIKLRTTVRKKGAHAPTTTINSWTKPQADATMTLTTTQAHGSPRDLIAVIEFNSKSYKNPILRQFLTYFRDINQNNIIHQGDLSLLLITCSFHQEQAIVIFWKRRSNLSKNWSSRIEEYNLENEDQDFLYSFMIQIIFIHTSFCNLYEIIPG